MAESTKSTASNEKSSTDARILRSRAVLIQAGRQLLNKNYETSMSDIASHAGVGRATLYRLFETKDELLIAIAMDCLQAFERVTAHIETEAESASEAIRMTFRAVLPLTEEMQFITKLAVFAPKDDELVRLHNDQQDAMRNLMELAKEEGSINRELPTDWAVNVVDALLYAAWTMRSEQSQTDEELAELAFRTFCHGVGAPV